MRRNHRGRLAAVNRQLRSQVSRFPEGLGFEMTRRGPSRCFVSDHVHEYPFWFFSGSLHFVTFYFPVAFRIFFIHFHVNNISILTPNSIAIRASFRAILQRVIREKLNLKYIGIFCSAPFGSR